MNRETAHSHPAQEDPAEEHDPHDPTGEDERVTVSIINDFELIVEGVRALLAKHSDRVIVADAEVGGVSEVEADVALMDTFSAMQPSVERARRMLDEGTVRAVVLYTWDVEEAHHLVKDQPGFAGVMGKSATADELVTALETAASGELITPRHLRTVDQGRRRPPLIEPLSERELEVLAFIAEGFSNPEIARVLNVSAESVKTLARGAYTKIGVKNRAQASSWAARNGLSADSPTPSKTG